MQVDTEREEKREHNVSTPTPYLRVYYNIP